jgi:hypothetical protein
MNAGELKKYFNETIEKIKANPKLLADKRWRLENLYVINTKSDGKRIFKLTRAQRHFLDNMRHRNIILKSRQLGFSTLITLWILDEILFSTNKEAIAIAHVKEGMTDIFDKKAKFAIMNLPEGIKSIFNFKTSSKTKLQVEFSDGSVSSFGVSLSGRSGTYHYVHISEYAKLSKSFPQRAEEVITGTLPAVPFDGYVFMESTAEGSTGSFYDMYYDALKNKNKGIEQLFNVEFYPHFYNWTWDDMELDRFKDYISVDQMEPNNDINWANYQQTHNLSDKEMTYYYMRWLSVKRDVDRLNQEYPTTIEESFVSSGKPYFDVRKIVNCKARALHPEYYDIINYEVTRVNLGPLLVYKNPEKNRAYVVGGDTAEGLSNGDYSTLTVVDIETREIVAVYQEQIPPDEFYQVCIAVGKFYNKALLAIESNKDGLWVNNEIERSGYENLYYRQRIDDVTKQLSKTFGWKTDRNTRDTMLTELRSVFTERDILVEPLLDEMQSFVRNSRGKPEAMSGKHDDLIVSASIAYMVRKLLYSENFKQTLQPEQIKSKMDLIFRNY